MKDVRIDKETFLIKLVNGKIQLLNPHGEEASEKYEELRAFLIKLQLPKEDKDSK